MKTKADYKLALELIRSKISLWDPYGLVAGHAPSDEFDGEIARIAGRIAEMKNWEDTARIVSEVFSQSFSAEDFPLQRCGRVGMEIFTVLRQNELL